ncbi:MAG: hypothetical protein WCS88_03900 [Patescibacteria group bacterium]
MFDKIIDRIVLSIVRHLVTIEAQLTQIAEKQDKLAFDVEQRLMKRARKAAKKAEP